MSHPSLSHLRFTTSTSSSSFSLPSTTQEPAVQSVQHDQLREHSVHTAHLQAPSGDKLCHQESLWREHLQSSGKPRTTTPTIPAVRERVHRQRLGKTAHALQEHSRWSCAVGDCTVTNITIIELEFRRSRTVGTDHWNCCFLKELEYEETLVNPEGMSIRTRIGTGETRNAEVTFVQHVVEEKRTILAHVNTKSNEADLMTKCHTYEAHMKGCATPGLKLSRESRSLPPANFKVSSEITLVTTMSSFFWFWIWLTVTLLRIWPTLTLTSFCP